MGSVNGMAPDMRDKTMKKRAAYLAITTAAFGLLFVVSSLWLRDLYLFGWMAHNWKVPLFLWIIVLSLILMKQIIPAVLITIGHIVGTVLGQWIGDELLERSQALITPDMTPGQIHHLDTHYGFAIWVIIFAAFLIAGIIAEAVHRKKAQKA